MSTLHTVIDAVVHLNHLRHLAADPTPGPLPGSVTVNTAGILSFFLAKIAPILLGALGLGFVMQSRRGEFGKVATQSGISFWGLGFIAGAVALAAGVGDMIIKTVVG